MPRSSTLSFKGTVASDLIFLHADSKPKKPIKDATILLVGETGLQQFISDWLFSWGILDIFANIF